LDLLEDFFRGLDGRFNELAHQLLKGRNTITCLKSMFKALAKRFSMAVAKDNRYKGSRQPKEFCELKVGVIDYGMGNCTAFESDALQGGMFFLRFQRTN